MKKSELRAIIREEINAMNNHRYSRVSLAEESRTELIGKFYWLVGDYTDNKQHRKLQKLVGKDLFWNVGKRWFWDNAAITSMSESELLALIAKIQ